METSHAPLLAQRELKPVKSTSARDQLFWAALGSIGASLLFRRPLGGMVRRTMASVAVPFVLLGVYKRLKAKRLF